MADLLTTFKELDAQGFEPAMIPWSWKHPDGSMVLVDKRTFSYKRIDLRICTLCNTPTITLNDECCDRCIKKHAPG